MLARFFPAQNARRGVPGGNSADFFGIFFGALMTSVTRSVASLAGDPRAVPECVCVTFSFVCRDSDRRSQSDRDSIVLLGKPLQSLGFLEWHTHDGAAWTTRSARCIVVCMCRAMNVRGVSGVRSQPGIARVTIRRKDPLLAFASS